MDPNLHHRDSTRTPSPGFPKADDNHSPGPTASMSASSSPDSTAGHILNGYSFPAVRDPNVLAECIEIPLNDEAENVPRIISTLSSGGSSSSLGKPNRRRSKSSGEGGGHRRQKRLERNRESARLSRRRRKQYLEVLEEKVADLSEEMDKGRREHVSRSVWTIRNKRNELITGQQGSVQMLLSTLSRTSTELRVANSFRSQQLKSFALPPSSKFVLWLCLQNDTFFRGGRAASERLSAARIGERMLSSGNDRVTPAQSMWPLLCNEVGLSYDQEEKVRNFQRILLQTQESWLDRHREFAADKTMMSLEDTTQAVSLRFGQREVSSMNLLSDEQKAKFMSWAARNRNRLTLSTMRTKTEPLHSGEYSISSSHHPAANLYVLNHKLQNLLLRVPRAAPLLTGPTLKKLSRRPSFESLGCANIDKREEGRLSRDNSFASSGSLKRTASEMSMDDEDRPQVATISPAEAQASAAAFVQRHLGHIQAIVPPPPTPSALEPDSAGPAGIVIPAPTPVASMLGQPFPAAAGFFQQMDSHLLPPEQLLPPEHLVSSEHVPLDSSLVASHERKSSFLPPHLNVVPEEMWPDDGADNDFLMDLVGEDWGVGVGIDMDTQQ